MEAKALMDQNGDVTATGITGPVPWWSFSKTVIATAALRLVEQDVLALDDRVNGKRFTLRQLLRHEAGVPDYGTLPEYHEAVAASVPPWPVSELFRKLNSGQLLYEPGQGWAYSNIGFLLVAEVVERASGMPLGKALARLVLDPCKLTSARLAIVPADLDGVQIGTVPSYHPGWVFHGLVVGTVADAARLLCGLMAGLLVTQDTVNQMLDGRAIPEHGSAIHPDPAYGLGLMLSASRPECQPVGHSGAGPGSKIAVYAERGRTAAVWSCVPSEMDVEAEAFRLLGAQMNDK